MTQILGIETHTYVRNSIILAAWLGFAGPPARSVLVVLVQDLSKVAFVISLSKMVLVQGLLSKTGQYLNCPHATFICI